MKALTYTNTITTIPNWDDVHVKQPRGYAYETATHFIHIYGAGDQLWTISNGLTVSERKAGSLTEWAQSKFGAIDVQETKLDVGSTVSGVWRPGLYYDSDVLQGLDQTNADLRWAEQSLLLLVQRIDEILLFVEPTPQSLSSYGHKLRELLILSCTEVEAHWRYHLKRSEVPIGANGYTTKDYVKLLEPLRLSEYEIQLPRYAGIPAIRPFKAWNNTAPTQSLPWYAAYNAAKHDAKENFSAATLLACIEAIAANIALFSVRFGPFRLYHGGGMLSAVFNPNFTVNLQNSDPTTFYVPRVNLAGRGDGLTWGTAEIAPRASSPFKIA